MHVVVVEDDRDIGLMVAMLADLRGHEVESLTPCEAMARKSWSDVDVLIVDWRLCESPPLTGGDVIERARRRGATARCVVYSAVVGHFDAPASCQVVSKGHGVEGLVDILE